MRRMAAAVLVFEAFIALFFGLVAAKLAPGGGWQLAVGLGVVSVLLSGLLRFRWAYNLGWALQVAYFAAGFWVTSMFPLGVIFGALWWAALHYGAKGEQIKAERMKAWEAAHNE
jgi:Protein of unknown function (DUF4233)